MVPGQLARPVSCFALLHKSRGAKPVLFAMRASICGPISSLSWKAKTVSGQPGRDRMRWDYEPLA